MKIEYPKERTTFKGVDVGGVFMVTSNSDSGGPSTLRTYIKAITVEGTRLGVCLEDGSQKYFPLTKPVIACPDAVLVMRTAVHVKIVPAGGADD